jgi:hypothetical protein
MGGTTNKAQHIIDSTIRGSIGLQAIITQEERETAERVISTLMINDCTYRSSLNILDLCTRAVGGILDGSRLSRLLAD